MTTTTAFTRVRRRAASGFAVLAAAGLAVAGCSQETQDAASDAAASAGSDVSSAADSAGDSASSAAADATDGVDSGASATANNETAMKAIDTALEQFPDTTAIDFEREDNGFDIDVTDGTTVHEVTIGNDGTTVSGSEQDDLDSDKAAKVTAATTEMKDAIDTALQEVPGTLTDVELDYENDDSNGQLRWEIEIESGGNDIEVYVSATDGSLLGRDG